MRLVILITTIFSLLFTTISYTQTTIENFDKVPQPMIPDYSKLGSWAAHPKKKDKADEIPRPLRKEVTDLSEKVGS